MVGRIFSRRAGVFIAAMLLSVMQIYPAFAAGNCIEMMCEPVPVAEPAAQVPSCHAAATEESEPEQNTNRVHYDADSDPSCCSMNMAAAPAYSAYASKSQETRTGNKYVAGWLSEITAARESTTSPTNSSSTPHEFPPGERPLYLSNGSFLL